MYGPGLVDILILNMEMEANHADEDPLAVLRRRVIQSIKSPLYENSANEKSNLEFFEQPKDDEKFATGCNSEKEEGEISDQDLVKSATQNNTYDRAATPTQGRRSKVPFPILPPSSFSLETSPSLGSKEYLIGQYGNPHLHFRDQKAQNPAPLLYSHVAFQPYLGSFLSPNLPFMIPYLPPQSQTRGSSSRRKKTVKKSSVPSFEPKPDFTISYAYAPIEIQLDTDSDLEEVLKCQPSNAGNNARRLLESDISEQKDKLAKLMNELAHLKSSLSLAEDRVRENSELVAKAIEKQAKLKTQLKLTKDVIGSGKTLGRELITSRDNLSRRLMAVTGDIDVLKAEIERRSDILARSKSVENHTVEIVSQAESGQQPKMNALEADQDGIADSQIQPNVSTKRKADLQELERQVTKIQKNLLERRMLLLQTQLKETRKKATNSPLATVKSSLQKKGSLTARPPSIVRGMSLERLFREARESSKAMEQSKFMNESSIVTKSNTDFSASFCPNEYISFDGKFLLSLSTITRIIKSLPVVKMDLISNHTSQSEFIDLGSSLDEAEINAEETFDLANGQEVELQNKLSLLEDRNESEGSNSRYVLELGVTKAVSYRPYVSVMIWFKSGRFCDWFTSLVPTQGLLSLTFSNRIDPSKLFCRDELAHGRCHNNKKPSKCHFQHFNQIKLPDKDLIRDLIQRLLGYCKDGSCISGEQSSLLKNRSRQEKVDWVQSRLKPDAIAGIPLAGLISKIICLRKQVCHQDELVIDFSLGLNDKIVKSSDEEELFQQNEDEVREESIKDLALHPRIYDPLIINAWRCEHWSSFRDSESKEYYSDDSSVTSEPILIQIYDESNDTEAKCGIGESAQDIKSIHKLLQNTEISWTKRISKVLKTVDQIVNLKEQEHVDLSTWIAFFDLYELAGNEQDESFMNLAIKSILDSRSGELFWIHLERLSGLDAKLMFIEKAYTAVSTVPVVYVILAIGKWLVDAGEIGECHRIFVALLSGHHELDPNNQLGFESFYVVSHELMYMLIRCLNEHSSIATLILLGIWYVHFGQTDSYPINDFYDHFPFESKPSDKEFFWMVKWVKPESFSLCLGMLMGLLDKLHKEQLNIDIYSKDRLCLSWLLHTIISLLKSMQNVNFTDILEQVFAMTLQIDSSFSEFIDLMQIDTDLHSLISGKFALDPLTACIALSKNCSEFNLTEFWANVVGYNGQDLFILHQMVESFLVTSFEENTSNAPFYWTAFMVWMKHVSQTDLRQSLNIIFRVNPEQFTLKERIFMDSW